MKPSEIKKRIISRLGTDYIDTDSYELRYQCPFCEEEGLKYEDYKFYVSYAYKKKSSKRVIKPGTYFCQRCQATGNLNNSGLDLSTSNAEEGVSNIMDLLETLSSDNEDTKDESDYFVIPNNKPTPGTLAWEYIMSRGITPPDISYYDIRVSDVNSPRYLFGRFIIPNRIYSNIWTDMFTGRTYVGDNRRYYNPPSSKKNEIVFNLHRIDNNPHRIIINEGPINSIIAGRDSVATYGKYVSDTQLSMILSKNPEHIYVSLDSDARDKAEQLCDRIVSLSDAIVHLVELPEVWDDNKKEMKGLDASDLGKKLYEECLTNSKIYTNSSMYFIEEFLSHYES